jgi:hypothetical protein
VKTILFANAELLTGDDVALAVLHYSGALAEAGLAETIEVPILEADGSRGVALMLVGPASMIVAVDTETQFEELVDEAAVASLEQKIRQLRPVGDAHAEVADQIEWVEEI